MDGCEEVATDGVVELPAGCRRGIPLERAEWIGNMVNCPLQSASLSAACVGLSVRALGARSGCLTAPGVGGIDLRGV